MIRSLAQRGVYLKDIVLELRVHPRTVSRALKRNGAPDLQREKLESKLDRFKPTVDRLLSDGIKVAQLRL